MKRTSIDAKLFRLVKLMLQDGATHKEIAEYFDIGLATVGRISKHDTLEDYRQQMAATALEYRRRNKEEAKPQEKPEPKPETTQVNVTDKFMPYATQVELIRLLKEQNETLKLISNKLVFIVEQLA